MVSTLTVHGEVSARTCRARARMTWPSRPMLGARAMSAEVSRSDLTASEAGQDSWPLQDGGCQLALSASLVKGRADRGVGGVGEGQG